MPGQQGEEISARHVCYNRSVHLELKAYFSLDACIDEDCPHLRVRIEHNDGLVFLDLCRDRKLLLSLTATNELTPLPDECRTKDCHARKYPEKNYCEKRE